MGISIINFKDHANKRVVPDMVRDNWHYVGRSNAHFNLNQSALANPFKPTVKGVGETLEQYRRWLWERIQEREFGVMMELNYLYQQIKNGQDVHLVCWCHPNPCHADVIKRALESKMVQSILEAWQEEVNLYNELRDEMTLEEFWMPASIENADEDSKMREAIARYEFMFSSW